MGAVCAVEAVEWGVSNQLWTLWLFCLLSDTIPSLRNAYQCTKLIQELFILTLLYDYQYKLILSCDSSLILCLSITTQICECMYDCMRDINWNHTGIGRRSHSLTYADSLMPLRFTFNLIPSAPRPAWCRAPSKRATGGSDAWVACALCCPLKHVLLRRRVQGHPLVQQECCMPVDPNRDSLWEKPIPEANKGPF